MCYIDTLHLFWATLSRLFKKSIAAGKRVQDKANKEKEEEDNEEEKPKKKKRVPPKSLKRVADPAPKPSASSKKGRKKQRASWMPWLMLEFGSF